MKNILLALASTSFYAATAYFGYVENVEWALNLLKFFTWLLTPFMLLVLISIGMMTTAQRNEAAKKQTHPLFYGVQALIMLVVVGTMVAYGSFFTAAALLFCLAVGKIARTAIKTP